MQLALESSSIHRLQFRSVFFCYKGRPLHFKTGGGSVALDFGGSFIVRVFEILGYVKGSANK
jgi:hypothetical protein